MTGSIQMRLSPALQVKQAIVDHLRGVCGGFSNPIPDTQIRGILDVSGTPKDAYGVIVSCESLGDHFGNTGGVLVDVGPRICVFTHINEDPDGSLCDSLATEVFEAMRSIEYRLDGWICYWNGSWSVMDAGMDGSYRQVIMSARLPLGRYNEAV